MKIKREHVIGLLLFGIVFISCNKNDPGDFRDRYIGQYKVTEKINCYGFCSSCSSQKDTIIIVDYGQSDSTIIVLGREVILDSTGFYSAYHYGLRLWNDSISSNYMNGGLGCGEYEVYTGYRISDMP